MFYSNTVHVIIIISVIITITHRQYYVGIEVTPVKVNCPSALGNKQELSSGDYRYELSPLALGALNSSINTGYADVLQERLLRPSTRQHVRRCV